MTSHPRRIWLCADDYGAAPGVSAAIRELISRGRINATSIMVAAPHFDSEEAAALAKLNSGEKRAALGLHVTLTGPLRPLSANFAPLRQGRFLPLNAMLRLATARRLQPEPLANEIAAQLRKFIDVFGRPPDFLDGHQHIQLFPQVRDAFLKVVAERAPSGMGQAMRTGAARTAAAGPQGAGARHLKSWLPAQGKKARDCGQSGLCRLLRLQVAGELRQAVPALSVAACRMAA